MKSQFKIFLLTLVCGVFLSSLAVAQSNPVATISSDYGIRLVLEDANGMATGLNETYDIDFSNRGWSLADAQNAETYYETKSHLIDLELDYPNKKFVLTLELDAPEAANWDVNQWTDHLRSIY